MPKAMTHLWSVVPLVVLAAGHPVPNSDDHAAIERAKALDVRLLDSRLDSQPLGAWFSGLVSARPRFFRWTTVGCGLAKATDNGACVRAEAQWIEGRAAISVTLDVRVAAPMGATPLARPEVYEVSVDTIPHGPVASDVRESLYDFQTERTLTALVDLVRRAEARARESTQR